jgi:hypothetical protein
VVRVDDAAVYAVEYISSKSDPMPFAPGDRLDERMPAAVVESLLERGLATRDAEEAEHLTACCVASERLRRRAVAVRAEQPVYALGHVLRFAPGDQLPERMSVGVIESLLARGLATEDREAAEAAASR